MKAKSVLAAAFALSALVAGCGGAPGGEDEDKAASTPAATAEAKPDVAAAGDVTLTVWDQNVRGGQNAEIEELNKQFQAKYPNVKIERTKKSFEDLQKTVKLAASGADAPDVVQANQGRGVMGEMVKAGLLRPVTDYAKVYDWESRYSSTLLDLNKFSADGAEFGSGDLYGLSQMGEIVGVFYNKEKVPDAADDAHRVRGRRCRRPRTRATRRSCSATSRSGRASTTSRACSGQTADKQAIRDFVFARERRLVRHPGVPGRRDEDQGVGRQGLLQQGLQRHGATTRRGSPSRRASRAYLIAGTWVTADLAEQMGDKVGFMLMPGQDPNAPVSLGGEDLPWTITTAPRTRTWRRPTSTSSRTRTRPRCSWTRTTCRP